MWDALSSFPKAYNLSKRELYDKVIQDVIDGNVSEIHPDVYEAYSENLRKAVGGVLTSDQYDDAYFDLQAQLQANVSRFAAYKAYHLTQQLNNKRKEWTNDDDFRKIAQAMLNTFNRYQAAEYNTAVARARTAKQWVDFNADPVSNELYPNLKWLPSRSATPREEHIPFYGLVLPKTDPFWQKNQPGNLWNCKCDWEETDDPASESTPKTICAKGLEGNPAETGEVFTDECTYINKVSRTQSKKLEHYVGDKFLRKESKERLSCQQGKNITISKNDTKIDVVFDRKTTKHISNDIAQSSEFLWNEMSGSMSEILRRSTLVAHEPNAKSDKKPSAIEYYYYKYQNDYGTIYLCVEENFVQKETRHFFRLYSIVSKLRETAICY